MFFTSIIEWVEFTPLFEGYSTRGHSLREIEILDESISFSKHSGSSMEGRKATVGARHH